MLQLPSLLTPLPCPRPQSRHRGSRLLFMRGSGAASCYTIPLDVVSEETGGWGPGEGSSACGYSFSDPASWFSGCGVRAAAPAKPTVEEGETSSDELTATLRRPRQRVWPKGNHAYMYVYIEYLPVEREQRVRQVREAMTSHQVTKGHRQHCTRRQGPVLQEFKGPAHPRTATALLHPKQPPAAHIG